MRMVLFTPYFQPEAQREPHCRVLPKKYVRNNSEQQQQKNGTQNGIYTLLSCALINFPPN